MAESLLAIEAHKKDNPTGSGSSTVIRFSQPSAASPAVQNILPNILRSQSMMSPVRTHFASESGFDISRKAVIVIDEGNDNLAKGGTVGSVSASSEIFSRREYDLELSETPSTWELL